MKPLFHTATAGRPRPLSSSLCFGAAITLTLLTGCGDTARPEAEATARVEVVGMNDAPEIRREKPIPLTPVDLFDTAPIPVATPVAYLVSKARIFDADLLPEPDTLGIAIIALRDANGRWEFSTDSRDGLDGTWQPVGDVTPSAARVLSTGAWVRYVPPPPGTQGPARLTFRAWDGSDKLSSGTGAVNTEAPVASESTAAAFSAGSATAEHAFIAVDDPPQAQNDDAQRQPALTVQAGMSSDNLVPVLLNNDFDPDPDEAGRFGIVSINSDGAIGKVTFDPGAAGFGDEMVVYTAEPDLFRSLAAGATRTDSFRYTVQSAALNPTVLKGDMAAAVGDFRTAVIHYKNAVQDEPENASVRFALSKFHLDTGDPKAALKEAEKARSLGQNSDELNRTLALASVLSGDYPKASLEIERYGVAQDPAWKLVKARLEVAQSRTSEATELLQSLLDEDPENIEVLRALGQANLNGGNIEGSRAAIESILAARPEDIPALMTRAALDLQAGEMAEARDGFRKVLQLRPSARAARLGLAAAHIELKDPDSAEKALNPLGKDLEGNPQVQVLRARIAEMRGTPDTALVHLRSALQRQPKNRYALSRAADLSLRAGDYVSTEGFLARLREDDPDNESSRLLHGIALMRLGRNEEARALLENEDQTEIAADPKLLALLGTTYLDAGEPEAARASLERAASLAPESLEIRSQLALTRLRTGQAAQAMEDFSVLKEGAPDDLKIAVLEILAASASGNQAETLRLADSFVQRHGDTFAAPWNMRGHLRARAGEAAAAKDDFEAALDRQPDFYTARINLARLAAAEEDFDTARRQLQTVLEQSPHHLEALMTLSTLARRDNDRVAARSLWEEAVAHHPNAVQPRLLLARLKREDGEITEARSLVEQALALAPTSPTAQFEYASTMLLAGQPQDALPIAQKLLNKLPESPEALTLMSAIKLQLRDKSGFESAVKQLSEVAPESPQAVLGRARLALTDKRLDEARKLVDQLIASGSLVPSAQLLSGDIASMTGDYAQAAAAYQAAFEVLGGTQLMLKLDNAERRSGQGTQRLADWVNANPDDTAALFALGMQRHGAGAVDEAAALYKKILALNGSHLGALNNLAWVYHERGQDDALALAEKAYERAQSDPSIADTYGWILLAEGKREQALNVLQKAHQAAPRNGEIAFHYASAQSQVGDHRGAVKTLEELLKNKTSFGSRPDAEALLKKLGG